MGAYTDFLTDKSARILDAEDYLEELKEAAALFRTFDEALDTFLMAHGFAGDPDSAEEKTAFLAEKFRVADIPVPRDIGAWYSKHKQIARKTAFQLCFAFRLTVAEAADFLRRVCLSRGFDCHLQEEAVYFFALKNRLGYPQAEAILSQISPVKPARMETSDIVYTSLIADELDTIDTAEALVAWLNGNAERFGYNNATACELIRAIWESIAKEDGIAAREKKKLYPAIGRDGEAPPERGGEKRQRERSRADHSAWEIFLQILGLSGDGTAELNRDRSIKSLLKDCAWLHSFVSDSFPDRDGLNKILRGEHVSHERMRKLLILLAFYRFWAGRALGQGGYEAAEADRDRCVCEINDCLLDAGYPLLYPGNPYDFLFLGAIHAGYPLVAFRDYMRELYYEAKAI